MELFHVRVDPVTFDEAVERVVEVVRKLRQKLAGSHLGGQAFFIATPNPEQIVEAQQHTEFRDALNKADLAIPDGVGLVWASRLLRKSQIPKSPVKLRHGASKSQINSKLKFQNSKLQDTSYQLPARVSGIELFEALVERAAKEGWRVMLVGGRGDVASRAAKKLQISNDKLQIKGIEGLSDVKRADREEEKRLIEQINEYGSDLLFVGFGAPEQELWVARNLSKLRVKVVMVVGGAFDQIANPSLRPPQVIDRMGLGWLYRLVRQPWRIGRQVRLIQFGWMVLRARITNYEL